MTNYGYVFMSHDQLTTMLEQFDEIKRQIIGYGGRYIFATIDLPCKAICDSACWIDDAFRHMIETGNYLCAGALIRMQMDNALTAWAGLICDNDQKFLSHFLTGKEFKNLSVSWAVLSSFMPIDEMDRNNHNLTSGFLKRTLDKIAPGTKDLYEKSCKFIHPSAPLIKASWFGDKENTFVYKPWQDTKPVDYDEAEIVQDYLNACTILLGVMKKWLGLKIMNVEIAESGKYDDTTPVSKEIKAEVDQAIKPLLHKGKDKAKQ